MVDAWSTPGWTNQNMIPLITSDLPPMAVPADVTLVNIVAALGSIDGKHQSGFILFEASADLVHTPSGGVSHKPSWLGRILDGRCSIKIPATDNTVLSPAGWNYKVTVIVMGQVTSSFHCLVPTTVGDLPYTSLVPIV